MMRTQFYRSPSMLSLLICSLLGSVSTSFAQSLQAVKTDQKISIDGILDEEAWSGSAGISTFYQFEPNYNAPATFNTNVKVLYSSEMVYFGIECSDPDPSKITAVVTKRDGSISEDDAIGITLDTFHDKNSCYLFMTNPLGTQLDGRFADNGRTSDMNWDETWYSATKIHEGGWSCEIGIPLESINYDRDLTTWGFSAGRWIARLRENHFIVKDAISYSRVSQFGTLTNLNLKEFDVKKYSIIPYVQAAFVEGEKTQTNVGLDARFNPVSNLGLEFTLNPDFATIEADVERVNLTRFELSYPEKRPFFLEGAENYSTRIKQFYSRRIGEIPWGAKVNGKIGGWKVNGLATQSDPTTAGGEGEPGEKALYSVFRINKEFDNGSNIGLIGANRTYNDMNNGSIGLSGTLFFTDVLGMTTQFIKSYGEADKGTWTYFIRPAYDSQFSHFHVRYSHYGTGVKENMNSIGFIRHDDRKEFDTNIRHTFWINRGGFDSIRPSVNYNQYWSQSNYMRSWRLDVVTDITFLKMYELELEYQADYKAEYAPYFEKDFNNHEWGVTLEFDNNKGFSAALEYERGRNYDADLEVVAGKIGVKVLEGWDVSYSAEKTWLDPPEPGENSWIHYIRSSYYVNNDLFMKLFYQTKYGVQGYWRDLDFDLERKTFQLVLVWRFLPPFGSLQLAYQEGTTRHTDVVAAGRSFYSKFSWVF